MSCGACVELHHKKFKRDPNCGICKQPFLDFRNEVVWETWTMASGQLRTAGMGQVIGLDYAALPFVFDCLGVERSEWYIMLHKLSVIQKVATEQQRRLEEERKAHAK